MSDRGKAAGHRGPTPATVQAALGNSSGISSCTVARWRPKYVFMSPASKEGVEDGVMSVFLLLLGVVTTAAGLALVASGATTDTDIITPGTIAAVGGLLLVGIGTCRSRVAADRAGATSAHTRPGDAPARCRRPNRRRAFPFRPSRRSNSQPEPLVADASPLSPPADRRLQPSRRPPSGPPPSPAAAPAPAPAEDGAFDRLRAKFPTLARLENGSVVDGPEVPMVTQPPAPAEGNVAR